MATKKLTTLEQLRKLATRTKTELDELGTKIDNGVHTYSITKAGSADEGYIATYQLMQDGKTPVGDKINIPKDFLVKSATIETVESPDAPYSGAKVGDKYIDFVVNAKEGEGEASHVYLAVNELVDTYTAGNGIDISGLNAVSVKVDAANAHGLTVTEAGLQLGLASGEADGAMSSADKTKLDEIGTATDGEVDEMIEAVFGAAE